MIALVVVEFDAKFSFQTHDCSDVPLIEIVIVLAFLLSNLHVIGDRSSLEFLQNIYFRSMCRGTF